MSMSSSQDASRQQAIPAQLDFLTIFNPSLGTSDDTLHQQIVYFSNSTSGNKKKLRRTRSDNGKEHTQHPSKEEVNERLRQIGLAQGMVEFAKTFSDGEPVDHIETEKSRIVLHEIESGWWILASISLTRLPLSQKAKTDKSATSPPGVEYSSREVKPAALILKDLLRAHTTFLLHHASSLSALFVRGQRTKFMGIIGRYWDTFLASWSVLLHGNPVVYIYGGIKLAVCGELGIGVGEEDRGSGEREVLEGFVGRVEGMVDLVVSKFGDAPPSHATEQSGVQGSIGGDIQPSEPWLGTGADPRVDDGVIFLGTGALSRKSLRDVTCWMEDLYSWGSRAYGVSTNVSNPDRRSRRGIAKQGITNIRTASPTNFVSTVAEQPKSNNVDATDATSVRSNTSKSSKISKTSKPRNETKDEPMKQEHPRDDSTSKKITAAPSSSTATGKFVSFLKLGYGTHWSLGMDSADASQTQHDTSSVSAGIPGKVTDLIPQDPTYDTQKVAPSATKSPPVNMDHRPHFLVGLMGDLEADEKVDESRGGDDVEQPEDRILLRTLTVELERATDARTEAEISVDLRGHNMRSTDAARRTSLNTTASASTWESQDQNKTHKLRVVVYVNEPFIFTFFFELGTDSLAFSDLYKSLHHQLAPLQNSLLQSTKNSLARPEAVVVASETSQTPIYDLVWDPDSLTVLSTIPNIPEPMMHQQGEYDWTRMEALNTHSHILNMYSNTRLKSQELEHTSKTSRGWWIVWARIIDANSATQTPTLSKAMQSISDTCQTSTNIATAFPNVMGSNRQHALEATPGTTNTSFQNSTLSGPAHPFLDAESESEGLESKGKEVFLVRRASDHEKGGMMSARSVVGEGWGIGDWSGGMRLAQGIGVDTKRYIDDLLRVGR